MSKQPSVLHLNTQDIRGGAARAAYRLHCGLRQRGVDSAMLVAERYSNDPAVTRWNGDPAGYWRRRLVWRQLPPNLLHYWPTRPAGYAPFHRPGYWGGLKNAGLVATSDIVNLHWINGFVDLPRFVRSVCGRNPVVWTLHDMYALTGGCHTSLECDKYLLHCKHCPQLGSFLEHDASYRGWKAKQAVFESLAGHRFHLVTPSRWLAAEVRAGALTSNLPVSVIPNSLDTTVFVPINKAEARHSLDIPIEARIVLFVADSLGQRHKGFSLLTQAFRSIDADTHAVLVSLGARAKALDESVNHLHLGRLRDDHSLARAYCAADLFVIPSLQDNLPNTVMEAMACGTPVVGFKVGGIPDMVRHGETGLLVPPGDVEALRHAIVSLLRNPDLCFEMSRNARLVAEREYSLSVQSGRYLELYQSLLAGQIGQHERAGVVTS